MAIPAVTRNALGVAFDCAKEAADKAADAAMTLDVWSARTPLVVNATQRTELVKVLAAAHKALYRTERALEAAMLEAHDVRPVGRRQGVPSR